MSSIVSNESVLSMPAEAAGEEQFTELGINTGIPRWVDVGMAIVGLIITAPVIGVLGLGIAMTSGLPVFFRQKRVGRHGSKFNLVKLRTMKSSLDGPQITRKGDERITRLGRFLRQTKLDELPTLWNVLRGDMALVGPRPEVPRYVELNDPLWQIILKVRPGLTDPVTLRLRNEEDLLAHVEDSETYYLNELQPSKLRGYTEYLHRRTWRSDLGLLFRTFAEIIHSRS
jgi:lipopolysaccharide/colanic/teichoic acid biosynthesis glycosyltransferase